MKKILICHPDEATRESLKLLLCDHYELILTNSFEQGLDILNNAKDVFLYLLNIDSTKEFSPKNVKAVLDDYPKLKVIVLSDRKFNAKAEEAVKYGAVVAVNTPYKSEELLAIAKKYDK